MSVLLLFFYITKTKRKLLSDVLILTFTLLLHSNILTGMMYCSKNIERIIVQGAAEKPPKF